MRDKEENSPRSIGGEKEQLHKGEQQASNQQHAPSVSKKGKEKHQRDNSDSNTSEENTTKKGSNAV